MANRFDEMRSRFEAIAPIDYRYWDKKLALFISAEAYTAALVRVEVAIVKVLARRGICDEAVADEVADAIITATEVQYEEDRIRHDIRALANCIRNQVSDEAKPFVHYMATSFDIIDTARALMYKRAVKEVILPNMIALIDILTKLALREVETPQIFRTHGQHALPGTFGLTIAGFTSRLGQAIDEITNRAEELVGKFSGAVGAYNAASLIFSDPEKFEEEVLAELDLKPGEFSTQVVMPEPTIRLFNEIAIAGGILANLARDMRNLQRTEINEVGEEFGEDQVGSSTMTHKRNPINFENIESLWKVIAPRMMTLQLDQISEHQRDLTNSASARTYVEILGYFNEMVVRMTKTMGKLWVDAEQMKQNLSMQGDLILGEPFYLMLAKLGHPDAHEVSRVISQKARDEKRLLLEVALEDEEVRSYIDRIPPEHKAILSDPTLYQGVAAEKAKRIAERWRSYFMGIPSN